MLSTQEISNLEKRYKKYIIKKRIKLILSVIALILFTITITIYYMLFGQQTKENRNLISKSKVKTLKKDINQKPILKSHNQKKKKDSAKLKTPIISDKNISNTKTDEANITKIQDKNDIKPTQPIAKNVETADYNRTEPKINTVSNIENNITESKNRPIAFHLIASNDTSYLEYPKGKLNLNIQRYEYSDNYENQTDITANSSIKPKKRDKKTINIEMNEIDSISYLKEKFQKTNNIIFALMLCEEYYAKKDYKNTLKWSIIANDLDSNSERSWIWFAKAKYRLNKKDDAIKALNAYLRINQSENIKELLNEIKNGELND